MPQEVGEVPIKGVDDTGHLAGLAALQVLAAAPLRLAWPVVHGQANPVAALRADAPQLAMVHAFSAVLGFVAPQGVMRKAREAALHALDLDETVADAHAALGLVLNYHDWDWPGAEREYRRALELNPGDTLARAYHAMLLGCEGRADAAIADDQTDILYQP